MKYNLHILLHFPKLVRMNGNLWNTSTDPYESNLHYYKQKVSSSKGVPIQITKRVIKASYRTALENVVDPSQRVNNFLDHVTSRKERHANCVEVEGCVLLGTGEVRELKPKKNC